MKSFFIFVIIMIPAGQLVGRYDSLYVTVNGDTAIIWNSNVYSNCASQYEFDVTVGSDTVMIVERDTVGPLVNCTCIFDLNVRLTNISGNRTAVVYRQELKKYHYPADTTLLIGSVGFSVSSSGVNPVEVANRYQSECGGAPVEVKTVRMKQYDGIGLKNYPNPFNPVTSIVFTLPSREFVILKIYDILGNEIALLISGQMQPGDHTVRWNAAGKAGGIYIYRLQAGSIAQTGKLVLLR